MTLDMCPCLFQSADCVVLQHLNECETASHNNNAQQRRGVCVCVQYGNIYLRVAASSILIYILSLQYTLWFEMSQYVRIKCDKSFVMMRSPSNPLWRFLIRTGF